MSCGGGMLRMSHQPLAHMVDAAAEKWLAAATASTDDQLRTRQEITRAFRIGDQPTLTFHGLRFLLTISRPGTGSGVRNPDPLEIKVHRIALPG